MAPISEQAFKVPLVDTFIVHTRGGSRVFYVFVRDHFVIQFRYCVSTVLYSVSTVVLTAFRRCRNPTKIAQYYSLFSLHRI